MCWGCWWSGFLGFLNGMFQGLNFFNQVQKGDEFSMLSDGFPAQAVHGNKAFTIEASLDNPALNRCHVACTIGFLTLADQDVLEGFFLRGSRCRRFRRAFRRAFRNLGGFWVFGGKNPPTIGATKAKSRSRILGLAWRGLNLVFSQTIVAGNSQRSRSPGVSLSIGFVNVAKGLEVFACRHWRLHHRLVDLGGQ